MKDFMPLPNPADPHPEPYLPWLVRRVEVLRGTMQFSSECAPAFDYARSEHTVRLSNNDTVGHFDCMNHIHVDLKYTVSKGTNNTPEPTVKMVISDVSERGFKGSAITSQFTLSEGQVVTFILSQRPIPSSVAERNISKAAPPLKRNDSSQFQTFDPYDELGHSTLCFSHSFANPEVDFKFTEKLLESTQAFWLSWVSKMKYKGRWREIVLRNALTLKLLTFSPTGAIIAAPTFSLPEDLHGAGRNWDYRYAWLRDSSFTVYALVRLGFQEEANAYVGWISSLLQCPNDDGGLQIVYTIHGEREMPEVELSHLEGHKGQKPVRIGNGAADHLQLDVYGAVLDAVYLAQKYAKPLSYDNWVGIRNLVDYVVRSWDQPDLSIWEVRSQKQNFLYSKIMCWVAIDRGLRLAHKRCLPCPNRCKWFEVRDAIYEEIQQRGYNKELGFFSQSYENNDVLDSSVLIMTLTFFIQPCDPRLLSTLQKILASPEKGGLTSNNLVSRYDVTKVNDGIGGEEGAFSLCTLWTCEALCRAGAYDKKLLTQSMIMLEDFLGYASTLGLFSEEIGKGGQALGNYPQGFSSVSCISACFNIDRASG
ncbi:putative glycosyl hydrolase [Wallemia mellicola]|nr:putative glycosyl hydrolase [Wallemia mellicola]